MQSASQSCSVGLRIGLSLNHSFCQGKLISYSIPSSGLSNLWQQFGEDQTNMGMMVRCSHFGHICIYSNIIVRYWLYFWSLISDEHQILMYITFSLMY